ncbi:MAG: hypothetical protein H3C48_16575 [Chitinophagaceae bacterium]|nr:hypothetical protein [Chitinophagaceae bacterium]
MDDSFILTVPYNGKNYELNTKFIRLGFIYQFHIGIEGRTFIFERDEEHGYRVIDTAANGKEIDKSLLKAIVDKLSSLQD